jgi:ornithine cyclodeaminase
LAILDLPAIKRLVAEADALASARLAFQALATGRVNQPTPMGWDMPDSDVHVKGAWIDGDPIFVLKAATSGHGNRSLGLPSGSGFVAAFDAMTARPCAILMDDGYLTDLRTGAAGALAVKLLAPAQFRTLAVVGSGAQARFQLRAISQVATWHDTVVWSPHEDRCAACCAELSHELSRVVRPALSLESAIRHAEVIITTTPARTVLVRDEWVGAGATVIAVGADGPGKQELDPYLVARADKLVVDLVKQSSTLGELQHALSSGLLRAEDVHAELGAIVTGTRPARERADERIVCDLTGTGAQDAAIAATVWLKHCQQETVPPSPSGGSSLD